MAGAVVEAVEEALEGVGEDLAAGMEIEEDLQGVAHQVHTALPHLMVVVAIPPRVRHRVCMGHRVVRRVECSVVMDLRLATHTGRG